MEKRWLDMPTYSFYNTETNEQFEDFMSWSQRETYLKENPHIEPMLTTAALVGDHIIQKVDGGMKDVFSLNHTIIFSH